MLSAFKFKALFLFVIFGDYLKVALAHGDQNHFEISENQAKSFLKRTRSARAVDAICFDENDCEPYIESCIRAREVDGEMLMENYCKTFSDNCQSGQNWYWYYYCTVCYPYMGCTDDPCVDVPCEKGGTCQRNGTDYTCYCPYGFDGRDNCTSECRPGPADIIFLIDVSHSTQTALNKSLAYISTFIQKLPMKKNDFKLAAISYSKEAKIEFDLTDNLTKSSLLDIIRRVESVPGPTFTEKALTKAYEVLTGRNSSNNNAYVIIVADGLSTNRTSAYNVARNLTRLGSKVKLFAVGSGEDIGHEEFLQLVSDHRYIFSTQNDDTIQTIFFETLFFKICRECNQTSLTDVMLMVDMSSSLRTSEFQQQTRVIKDFVKMINIENNEIDIGLTKYGDESNIILKIGQYNMTDEVVAAVSSIRKVTEISNTSAALQKVKIQGFENGRRSDARKVVVLFSNGNWSNMGSIKDEIIKLDTANIKVLIVINGRTDLRPIADVVIDPHNVYWIEKFDHRENLKAMMSEFFYVKCESSMFSSS